MKLAFDAFLSSGALHPEKAKETPED